MKQPKFKVGSRVTQLNTIVSMSGIITDIFIPAISDARCEYLIKWDGVNHSFRWPEDRLTKQLYKFPIDRHLNEITAIIKSM